MTSTLDVRIDSIAAGGDGVGRDDGLVIFVPRTAPGDRVRVRAEHHGRLMRGTLLEVLEPSPERAAPACPHYVNDRCGGCQVQHLTYDAQLRAKSGIVRDALTRIGRVAVDLPAIEPSAQQWRYRTKLTLTLRPQDERWIAGLHRFDAPEEIFDLTDCPITDETVMQHWHSVLAVAELLPKAKELRGAVRLLQRGFSFTLEGGRSWPSQSEFFAKLPALEELWWKPQDQARRRMSSRSSHDLAGASFIQVNPHVASPLRDWVVGIATSHHPQTVVDAYSGTGDLAAMLAGNGTRVTAIELDREASRVCAARLPAGSQAIADTVEAALPRALPADLVVLNPPRAGVHERVTEMLRDHTRVARSIVYVSCNPATLARDVRRMEGWQIRSLRAFDMFPQTAHVETVCELVPAL